MGINFPVIGSIEGIDAIFLGWKKQPVYHPERQGSSTPPHTSAAAAMAKNIAYQILTMRRPVGGHRHRFSLWR